MRGPRSRLGGGGGAAGHADLLVWGRWCGTTLAPAHPANIREFPVPRKTGCDAHEVQIVGRDAEIAQLEAPSTPWRRRAAAPGRPWRGGHRQDPAAGGWSRAQHDGSNRSGPGDRAGERRAAGAPPRGTSRSRGRPRGGAEARWQLSRTAGDLLASRGGSCVLDDVHWADPVSLELLETLVRRPPDTAHVLVVGSRPGAVADALLVAARSAGRPATVLDLAPLSRAAADELVGGDASEADRSRMFEISGGNPMFLEELARAEQMTVCRSGSLLQCRATWPLLERMRSELVRAGAVLGDPFDIEIARRTVGLDLPVALAAVDELVDRGLVRGTSTLLEFSFRHPVVRSAVYEGQSSARRLTGHARAAEVLGDTGAGLPSRARHLAHTAAPGDLAARRCCREAAAMVRSQAPSIAADWLFAAKRVAPRPTSSPTRSWPRRSCSRGVWTRRCRWPTRGVRRQRHRPGPQTAAPRGRLGRAASRQA